MSPPLLEVDELTVAYGGVVAVREASLTVGDDELVVVLGANGAGKTTLLSAVIGWLRPQGGTVRFAGEDLRRASTWQRTALGIGLVPEGGRTFGDLTVWENLAVSRPTPRGLDRAYELFPILRERRDQPGRTLSGGQRQMLAIARAIATEPKLLLVDEASTGLMPTLVERVFAALRQLREQRLPVLLVEQNTTALEIADRGYVMEAGRIVRTGTAVELARDPEVRRAYLGL